MSAAAERSPEPRAGSPIHVFTSAGPACLKKLRQFLGLQLFQHLDEPRPGSLLRIVGYPPNKPARGVRANKAETVWIVNFQGSFRSRGGDVSRFDLSFSLEKYSRHDRVGHTVPLAP